MDQDPRAVQYTVAPELQIEVQMPRTVQTNFWTMAPLQTKLTQPTICFLPDGFISQSSPYEILLRAPRDNDAVWLAESANRLSYEIRTNQLIYGRY
jgi:hypothetical protein